MSAGVRVAVDLGAESGRAVVGRFDGRRLELSEAHRFPNRGIHLPDGLYWDALGLYGEISDALAELGGAESPVESLGIDSWGCDFGLLDRHGTLVSNPLHHRDGRGGQAVEKAAARVPADELYRATGIQFLPFNTVFQLLALEGTQMLESAETMLLIPDLLGYWLTGERSAEATNASTTQLLDVHTGEWSEALISRLGLPGRIFPEIAEAGTVLGGLLPRVAATTRLPVSTPVVSVASHDTASAVVAVPFAAGGRAAYISSGTWSLVGVELAAPALSDEAHGSNLTNERGFGGTIRLLKNVMGLWLVQECRRAWSVGPAPSYGDMAELAGQAPAGGPLFDPDLPELLAPGEMPARIRAACAHGGQRPPEDDAALIRAVFESLACKYRVVLEGIERVIGEPIEVVHVIGGGAMNAYLCRLTANVTRRPVLAGPVEAAALGNLLVQLHAFGEVGGPAEMRELVCASTEITTWEPDADASGWEDLYDRFVRVTAPELVGQGAGR